MNDNRTVLYNALKSEGYTDIGGSQEEFNKLLENPDNLRVAYDAMKNSGYTDIGNNYDEFASLFAVKEQPRGMTKAEPEINGSAWDDYKDVGKIQKPTEPGEKETLTTFGEGVKQGADAIYQGNKYFAGEQARFWNGAQQDAKRALEYLDAQGEDFDAKGWDVRKAMDEVAQKQWEKDYEDYLKVKEERRKERKEGNMGMWERFLHKVADPSMPESLEARRINPTNMSYQRPLLTLNDALKEADGDIVKAREILEKKASEEQWADKTMREASEAMAKHKPVKGAAWWGQMVPQVAGQATAIASNFVPYVGGFLGKALSYGTTAGLTASSAGQAMAEARRAGASDDEVWSAGVAQAVIEAGSEQIPLNRLIGKTGSAAFKKGYKAFADNIPEKELEKLLVEGNKRLGGKLLSGKNAKEFIKDMGVEGASEFVAEFLGTYVPIIYEDKENYPTLLEAVKNGWEGAKGGFAMGGFLGGGSMVLTNRMQENRRKKQGFVELATDKDGNVVEVIGEKDGLVTVLTQDGATEEHNHEDLNNVGSFTYDEWKNAKVDIEQRENKAAQKKAFAKGYNEPAVNTGDALNVAEQEAKTALGLNTEESIEDFMDGRSIDEVAMDDEDLKAKLNNYFQAKAEDEGRRAAVEEMKATRYAEVDAEIDGKTNTADGALYSTALPTGENIAITGGKVVLDGEGYIDVNQSEGLVALMPDGTKMPVRVDELREKIEVSNAQELKASRHAEIDAEIEAELSTPVRSENTVSNENAQEVNDNAVDVATETPVASGKNVSPDKTTQPQVVAPKVAELPDFFRLNGKNYTVVSRNEDGSVNAMLDGKRTTLPADTDFAAVMPTDKGGNVQFAEMPIERTLEYFVQRVSNGKARAQMIENNRKQAESVLKKFDKEPNVGTDPDAYDAAINKWEADKKAAQAKVDYWNEVAERDAEIQRSEMREAVEAVKPRDVVEKTADEFVASVMPKITPESFKAETGLSNTEQKSLVGIIASAEKGGVTIEQAAESILENYGDELRGLGFNGDVQDMRDIIINILSTGNPRSYAKKGLEMRQQADIEQQMRELESVANALGFETIDEQIKHEEAVVPSIIQKREGFDETEYFNNLAENIEYDTTGESEGTRGSSELLQGKQSADNAGTENIAGPGQGGEVQGDVYSGGENAAPQGNQQVNGSEFPNSSTGEVVSPVEGVAEGGNSSVPSQQTPVNNLNENNDGREEITAADNSGAQLGREEFSDTEQVGAGVPIQDTARNSKSKRRNAGVGSSKLGNGPQYDANRNYTNEEIEEIVSSVTDIVDGKVVITGEVTDDIKAIVRGYESGGIAKKGRGILDEYYTDGKIVDAVNLLIAPYFSSSTPIRVLEPSIGIGNFIQAVNNIPTSEVVAFEINETTARIAKILYPDVDVNLRSFETEFIDDSGNKKPMPQKYSLVIGNPPYGSHRGLYKGLGEESKIARYEDYFVKRSLDVLDEGGVLAMVLPSSWMDRHTKFGGYTIERAYRLPSGAFEATQVGTDIVILKKDSSIPVTEHVPYFEQFPERVLGEVKQRKGRYGRLEEYVEGDIDAAIEAIKKENAEQVADLLDIEKNNDALNDIESAVDETGSTEKAVAVVKDAQESEKADKKTAEKPSGKQGKYKVELNRGVETVPTSAQFTHEFSEGEVEAFADTDYEGALSNPAKHRRYANYIGGQAIHDFYYAEGDIYSKLAQLEQEKHYIVENYGVEQYEKQKALLESVLPKQKSLEEITISPNTTFVKNLNILTEGGRVSLKDMFVDFLRKLPHQAFGNSSSWEVVGYINNEQVHGTDKQRNQLVRERRKRAANDLFNKFLNEELSDNAKKQVIAAFNREYNSTYRPDYSKVPMFSTINRDFKGKPLKLTSVQLAGIGRMTVKGVGVLAHEVGFGKTLSGILAMHEAMTRGFAKKPLIVVPNDNILKQWVETIGEVLPSATVNTLGNLGAGYDLTDFKVNDGEFTIITYEGLKAMSFSDGTYNHLASKFSYITEDLNKHQSERDIQKDIEKKNELKGKMKRGTKSAYMFEDFGFDWLTVDEVHNANHIVSKVRLDKSVASDFRSQSQRTSDLGLKTWLAAQYIQEENNGRNVLLLSATPFTNKPLEYYSILSLVGNDMLERKGFFNVDQFFATFMEADNELEIGANGRPTQKTNVRRFRNNGLFQQLLSEFIDIKGEEDNPELVRPERLNKEYKIAQNELTVEAMAAAQELLSDNDTVLQGIGHARAAAFSPYATSLLGMQPKNHKEFVKSSPKIDATIKMIEQNIKDRPDAGQIIYSEVGVEYFPLIRDYLVKESGLKPSEVRIITGATSNNERVNIQSAFNNGEVKVVVGSPAIKEGLNLQGNTTDMYILSLPWNFTQLRQIEGRGWRQGNKWEKIRINYMLTNDSVDVFMLQRLQLKQGLYNEAMKSGAESLDVSDIDTADLKTALITDPAVRAEVVTVQERAKLQQEKTQIEADLSFVMRKYEAYNKLVSKLESQKNTIKMYREWAKKGDEYWAQRVEREEAQLTSIENEIEEEKQNLIKKGVNVDDIVRQTQQSQNDIAAIQEKIDNLKEFQEELTQKFREESEAKTKEQGDLVSTYIKERKAENKGGFYKIRPVKSENKAVEEDDDTLYRSDDTMYRIREEAAPKNTGIGYKVFVLKNGKLYPPMVANPNGEATPVGVWLDADAAPVAGQSKTGRSQVKAGGKGTQGGSGKLAYRPGWHLGEIPYALQFNRNDENGERTLFPANFVWAEVEYANDVDYQEEAMSYGYNQNGKFQHSYAGLPRVPENGAYRYRTNPNPDTDPWIITGAMRVKRLLTPTEVDEMVKAAGREPQRRQEGAITDEQINALNAEIANDYREGGGSITDREVVMDSDPYSKALGRPRYTGRKMGEYVARQRMEMAKRVKALAQKLNLNIDVLESTEGLSGKRAKAKGWYESKGKRIVVVIPNHSSVNDAVATVLHEAVAHHGLRELFGENFDTFLQNVYNNADADVREAIETLAAQRYNGNLLTATEEYLASLAENTDFEYAAKSGWWERIKDYFFKMLRGLGIEGFDGITLTDNELRYILWRSYQNLANPGMYNNVFGRVKDTALQYELKVGNYAPAVQNGSMVAGEDITPEMQESVMEGQTMFRVTQEALDVVNEFNTRNRNTARVIFADGEQDLREQLSAWDFTQEDIEVVVNSYKNGTLASYFPEYDKVLIYKHDVSQKELNGYLWHENAHRAVEHLFSQEEMEEMFLDMAGDKIEEERAGLLENGYEEAEQAEEYIVRVIEEMYLEKPAFVEQNRFKAVKGAREGVNRVIPKLKKIIDFIQNGNEEDSTRRGRVGSGLRRDKTEYQREVGRGDAMEMRNAGNKGGNAQEATTAGGAELLTSEAVQQGADRMDADEVVVTASAVKALAQKLNTNVNIVEDSNSLPENLRVKKGWYDPKTGEVVVVMDNHVSMEDALQTVLHEIVGHRGLQVVLGDRMGEFLNFVYNNLPKNTKGRVNNYVISQNMKGNPMTQRQAVEEYIAELAERGFEGYNDLWNGIRQWFRDFFRNFMNVEVTDGELRYMLWKNYQRLQMPNVLTAVQERVMENSTNTGDSGLMFRSTDGGIKAGYEKAVTGWWNKFKQGYYDQLRAVRKAQELIAKASGKKIADSEDVYSYAEHLPSINKIMAEQFDMFYMKPFTELLKKLHDKMLGGVKIDDKMLERYANAKHGLERNREMAVKEALTSFEEVKGKKRAVLNEKGYNDWKGRKADILAKKELSWEEKQRELDKLAKTFGAKLGDYSGITAIFDPEGKMKYKELSELAIGYVNSVEQAIGKGNTDEFWKQIKGMTKYSLEQSYKSGLISKDTYDTISGLYSFYVPLRGFTEQTAEDIFDYVAVDHSPLSGVLKRAKGRTSEADNIFATIVNMAHSSIVMGNKNKMKQMALNLAMNHPTPLLSVDNAWYAKVGDEYIPQYPDIKEGMDEKAMADAFAEFEARMKEMEKNGEVVRHAPGLNIKERVVNSWNEQQHAIRVKRNGKEYVVWVNGSPTFANAINGMLKDNDKIVGLGWLDAVNRFRSKAVTQYSPTFIFTNLFRDVQSASMVYGVLRGRTALAKFEKNLGVNSVAMMKLYYKYQNNSLDVNNEQEKFFKEFLENGGETGYTEMISIEEYQKMLNKLTEKLNVKNATGRAFEAVGDGIEFANRCVENLSRFSAYMTSRQMGMSIMQSVNDAKEVSVNFNRRGSGEMGAKVVRKWFMFFNPAVQSVAQRILLTGKYPKRMVPILAAELAAGAAMPYLFASLSALLGFGPDDEEDDTFEERLNRRLGNYYNLTDYRRRSSLCFPTAGGVVNIPLSHEARVFFGLGELVASIMTGHEVYDNIPSQVMNVLGQSLPFNPVEGWNFGEGLGETLMYNLTPDAIKPFVEVGMNRDFAGNMIHNRTDYNRHLPEWMRGRKGTAEVYKAISRGLSGDESDFGKNVLDENIGALINPSNMEHLVKGYLGGAYTFLEKGAKAAQWALGDEEYAEFRNIPIASSFYTSMSKYEEKPAKERTRRDWEDAFKYYQKEVGLLDNKEKAVKNGIKQNFNNAQGVLDAMKNDGDLLVVDVFNDGYKVIKELYSEADVARSAKDMERLNEINNEIYAHKRVLVERMEQMAENPLVGYDFLVGKEDTPYGRLETYGDLRDAQEINEMQKWLKGVVEEEKNIEDKTAKEYYRMEHKKAYDLYDDLDDIERVISKRKRLMTTPEKAQVMMGEIRKLRSEAIDLIRKYNE